MDIDFHKAWDKLKTQRDELNVQAHLAKSEFRDELEGLESKWQALEKKYRLLEENASEKSAAIKEDVKIVVEELSAAYHKIKDRLS
ncbi:MAG: hypothetical protein JKY88_02600 [Pseudomonadales bacterium]|nr:hypothetical protein [Pseudomonadales bacterium]